MNGFHEDLKYNLRADAYRDALRKLKRAQEEEGEIPIIDFLVVANERSKRYYLPSDKSYRQAAPKEVHKSGTKKKKRELDPLRQ